MNTCGNCLETLTQRQMGESPCRCNNYVDEEGVEPQLQIIQSYELDDESDCLNWKPDK